MRPTVPEHPSARADNSTKHDGLVSRLVSPPSARLAIIGTDDSTQLSIQDVIQDSRVNKHFASRCVLISCDGMTSSDVVVDYLATWLGIGQHQSRFSFRRLTEKLGLLRLAKKLALDRLTLMIEMRADRGHIDGILKGLAEHSRTLIVLDNLNAIYSCTDPEQRERTDVLLASLASVDKVVLLISFSGVSLPHSVSWDRFGDPEDEALLGSSLHMDSPLTGPTQTTREDAAPDEERPSRTANQVETVPVVTVAPLIATASEQPPQVTTKYASDTISQEDHRSRSPPQAISGHEVVARNTLANTTEAQHERCRTQPSLWPSTVFQSRLPPAKPAVFHGRVKELDRLVAHAITPNTLPIGIVGPGGIGKTTLALKVLHEPRVLNHFEEERFFLSCETATSPDDVLGDFALKLGMPRSQSATFWSAVLDNLRARSRVILILDNFETIWSPTNDSLRQAAEAFLARLAVVDELTFIVTTRGSRLPSIFTWANHDTAELDTLSSTAARQTFKDRCCIKPDILASDPEAKALTKLLQEIDFVPLAVTLLARLDDLPSRLLREWSEYRTEVLEADQHDGTRRELSVTVSIKISLAHLPDEGSDLRPRQLLSVLGQLPCGLLAATSDKLRATIPNIDSAVDNLLRHSLAYVGGSGEVRILSPVRHYISVQIPMSRETRAAVISIYAKLAANHPTMQRLDIDGPAYDAEIPNILSVLTIAIDVIGGPVVRTIGALPPYCARRGYSCLQFLQKLLARIEGDMRGTAICLLNIGHELKQVGDYQRAIDSYERAANFFAELGDVTEEYVTRASLPTLLRLTGRHQDAERQQVTVDELERESQMFAFAAKPVPEEHPVEAEQRYRDALQERLQAGDWFSIVVLCDKILQIVGERGDDDAYTKELEAVIALGEHVQFEKRWLSALQRLLAQQYVRVNKLDDAQDLLIDAFAVMSGCNNTAGIAAVAHTLAHIRVKQGRFGEAIGLLQTASKLLRRVGDGTRVKEIEGQLEQLQILASRFGPKAGGSGRQS